MNPLTPSTSRHRPRVVIAQHRLLHYRQELFDRLHKRCQQAGIELHLVHGQPSAEESLKKDVGQLQWADVVNNRFFRVGGRDLIWQPFPAALRDADLVVLIQENRILSNYPWLLRWSVPKGQRVAYWGHGRNLQSQAPTGLRERWKKWFVTRVDWWFAYTDSTRAILLADGFPGERITVLDNAIDNESFMRDLASVSQAQKNDCLRIVDAQEGDPIALYCGSLWKDKRLDLLVEAGDIIHAAHPGFRLVVVGDGPSRQTIIDAAGTRPWLKWVGVKRGVDKAAWFTVSNAYLSPGAVGLHVLDAFCAGIPMITTANARHGPEVSYLVSGRNGFIVPDSASEVARAYTTLISDPALFSAVRAAAYEDAQRFSLDNMVQRFFDGIGSCLSAPCK
jgi:glycosyltransferase involved in cell wall biosynthesis